jgi:hypothetical protein
MNGSFRFSLYSTDISRRGIKGTEAGNNKWNYVSVNILENFSNFSSWVCLRANFLPYLFSTKYTVPNWPCPRILQSSSLSLN